MVGDLETKQNVQPETEEAVEMYCSVMDNAAEEDTSKAS